MKTRVKASRKKGKSTDKCVPPFPIEFRLKIAKLREEERYPVQLLAEQFGISQDSVYCWDKRYLLYGQGGLVNQARGKSKSKTPVAVTQSIIDLEKQDPARGSQRFERVAHFLVFKFPTNLLQLFPSIYISKIKNCTDSKPIRTK